ncbi:MAG: 50S ribosomal protein L4 [Candidatus Margulisiibacteriota bacterium]
MGDPQKKAKPSVVQRALVAHLANLRQGSANTKNRGEVSGGGKKPWQQKGTGRARAGDNRSPLWTGGGVIFGPKPRKYTNYMPRKERLLAMRMVLGEKQAENKVKIMGPIKTSGKTKEMVKVLAEAGISGKILVIMDPANQLALRAARNIKQLVAKDSSSVNIFDLLNCDHILAEENAWQQLEGALK